MRDRPELPGLPLLALVPRRRQLAPDLPGNDVGAESRQQAGDGRGIAGGSKEGVDAGGADGGEKITEVEVYNQGAAGVGCGVAGDGVAAAEAVRGLVGRD